MKVSKLAKVARQQVKCNASHRIAQVQFSKAYKKKLDEWSWLPSPTTSYLTELNRRFTHANMVRLSIEEFNRTYPYLPKMGK